MTLDSNSKLTAKTTLKNMNDDYKRSKDIRAYNKNRNKNGNLSKFEGKCD